jgi:hypothetical protein
VTNLHHRAVRVDPGEAALLALLDGTRDRTALRAELPGAASLDETLDRLARRALLLM